MRSYHVARGMFSLMSVMSWLIIGAGALGAIAGSSAIAEYYPRQPFAPIVLGVIPGTLLGILGLFGLAFAQMGRAGVDSAEYGQQMLQIARDSLDVSRQSLRHTEQMKTGFEALRSGPPERPLADYATSLPSADNAPAGMGSALLPVMARDDATANRSELDRAMPAALEVARPIKPPSFADLAASPDQTT